VRGSFGARWRSRVIALTGAGIVWSGLLGAQGTRTLAERIRSLAAQGDSSAARRLADSAATSAGSPPSEQAEGAYWRGMLANSSRERRVEFSRVVVEFPLTPAAGDALYRLAQMDMVAGDRAAARRQLERAFKDYGFSATAAEAAFDLSQLLLIAGESRDGCAALDSAIIWTPAEQVEKRNRMTYARRPCASLVPEPPRDSQPPPSGRGAAEGDTAGRGRGTSAGGRAATARLWSAQVGAFASKDEAERVALRLASRGYEARVTSEQPFRVRVGFFSKRADAAAMVTKLKGERTAAILVEAERR
jgi:cell division septation protein DedD